MAHVEHFKKSDVKKLVNEYDRDEKYMKSKDVSRIDLERVQIYVFPNDTIPNHFI